jgi:hypothetical protein
LSDRLLINRDCSHGGGSCLFPCVHHHSIAFVTGWVIIDRYDKQRAIASCSSPIDQRRVETNRCHYPSSPPKRSCRLSSLHAIETARFDIFFSSFPAQPTISSSPSERSLHRWAPKNKENAKKGRDKSKTFLESRRRIPTQTASPNNPQFFGPLVLISCEHAAPPPHCTSRPGSSVPWSLRLTSCSTACRCGRHLVSLSLLQRSCCPSILSTNGVRRSLA